MWYFFFVAHPLTGCAVAYRCIDGSRVSKSTVPSLLHLYLHGCMCAARLHMFYILRGGGRGSLGVRVAYG